MVDDGEHSKFNWMAYARARLGGLEEIDARRLPRRDARLDGISRAYDELKVMHAARPAPLVAKRRHGRGAGCAGRSDMSARTRCRPIIDKLKARSSGQRVEEAFITAISPTNLELYYENRYYRSDEEYLDALADAMREEY